MTLGRVKSSLPRWSSAGLAEHLQAVISTVDPDIQSPCGLYGYPPMWSILEDVETGRTLAVRPVRTQVRHGPGPGWQEVDGLCWGWHAHGQWIPGEQHLSGSMEHAIAQVIIPRLEAGARLRACPGIALGPVRALSVDVAPDDPSF